MEMKTLPSNYRHYYEQCAPLLQQQNIEEVLFFASLAPKKNELDILDIGCGEGILCIELAKQGHRVSAMDISQPRLDLVKQNAEKAKVKVECLRVDVESGTGRAKKFDLIYLMDVIEHFRNPTSALENIRTLLRPKGRLMIHTPNSHQPKRIIRYLKHPRRKGGFFNPKNCGDFHFQLYDFLSLEQTLNFTGLTVTRTIPTTLTLPLLYHFPALRHKLAARWPFLADTLLLECRRCAPIDIDKQVAFWKKQARRLK